MSLLYNVIEVKFPALREIIILPFPISGVNQNQPNCKGWRHSSHKVALTWHFWSSLKFQGVSKNPCFHYSLEGLTELTANCYTHGYNLLWRKNINSNQMRKKIPRAKFRKGPDSELPILLPPYSDTQRYLSLSMMYDVTPSTLPARGTHPCLWCKEFLLRISHLLSTSLALISMPLHRLGKYL